MIACQPPLFTEFSREKNTGVGCHFLLQGILLTQGSNSGLLHCRHILYHLSYEGSPNLHLNELVKYGIYKTSPYFSRITGSYLLLRCFFFPYCVHSSCVWGVNTKLTSAFSTPTQLLAMLDGGSYTEYGRRINEP